MSGDGQQSIDDQRFMKMALALGWRHQGETFPNPAVGAVIVKYMNGSPRIVGIGATQPGGRPHAEAMAIAMAKEAARDATLYVSLEPCSHYGRASPCSDAIIAAGIKRVVSPIQDPDPRVAGQGHARLRAAGISVNIGKCAEEAYRAHRGHILRVTQKRPLITLKMARTKDGYASRVDGKRLLITDAVANDQVHLLRAHNDAVMIGINTLLADDPQLNVRLPGMEGKSPIRIIVDSTLRIPLGSKVVTTASSVPTWVVTTQASSPASERALRERGVEIVRVEPCSNGQISLPILMNILADRGITRVLSEGGPVLATALAKTHLIDEALILTGSDALGGQGIPAIPPTLENMLADKEQFRQLETGFWGKDHFVKWERYF